MSNLVPYDSNPIVAEIVTEALDVTPVDYRQQLLEHFAYLAHCHAQDGMQSHLNDIQSLISAAQRNDGRAIAQMTTQLQGEIAQLRQETRQGFETMAGAIAQLNHDLDSRLTRLERDNRPNTSPVTVTVQNCAYWDGDLFFHIAGACVTTVLVWSAIKILIGGQN
jgi:hypothetical protein